MSSDTRDNNNNNNTTTITFAEQSVDRSHHEKIKQRELTRSSTGQSSNISFDARSVRSVIMKKMNLVKRRRRRAAEEERVEGPPYHTMDLDTVAKLLKTDLEDGLSEQEVEGRREEAGFNEMEGEGGVNPVKLLIKQFFNIMVLILLIAMVCAI